MTNVVVIANGHGLGIGTHHSHKQHNSHGNSHNVSNTQRGSMVDSTAGAVIDYQMYILLESGTSAMMHVIFRIVYSITHALSHEKAP